MSQYFPTGYTYEYIVDGEEISVTNGTLNALEAGVVVLRVQVNGVGEVASCTITVTEKPTPPDTDSSGEDSSVDDSSNEESSSEESESSNSSEKADSSSVGGAVGGNGGSPVPLIGCAASLGGVSVFSIVLAAVSMLLKRKKED